MTMFDPKSLKDVEGLPDDVALETEGGAVVSKSTVLDALIAQIDGVRVGVVAQRDDWVRYRASIGVEDRWRRALALYKGEEMQDSVLVDTLKNGPQQRNRKAPEAPRSRVVVNIVRPKTDQAIARMCEILLPTDDRNWGIKPTPVPEKVTKMLGDTRVTAIAGTVSQENPQGTPNPEGLTADQEAQQFIKDAKDKASRMQDAIDDQLTEANYNAEQRSAITDGVKLGTGILLGPFPAKQTSKVWTQGKLQFREATVPSTIHADPWDIWFDPAAGKNHQAGAGYWHKQLVTRKQIRALKGVLGFDDKALAKVLDQSPSRLEIGQGRVTRNRISKEQAYEMWTYHGELDPEQCYMISQRANGKPLKEVDFGVVILINDEVVGVMQSWIPDKTLPIDVWCWREDDGSPYGYGLPDELEHQQRVVTSAWRQVMDNARFAVGSQLVFLDGVTAMDGGAANTVYPGRMWRASPDKIDDARKAMAAVDFPSHLQELLAIADKAMEFADAESSLPQLIGGEQGQASETVGGMVMLYNNAQSVLRLRVKLYDDNMTRPHIGRYYDWNMANSKDEKIKGDMEVDARGSTALLERDIQNQATLNLATITSNPRYAPFLDAKEEIKTILKALKVQPESVMASDDQIKKNLENMAKAPPDPRIAAAEIKAAVDQAKIADNDKTRAVKREEIAYNQAREQSEHEIAMTEAALNRDLALMKSERDAGLTREVEQAKGNLKLLEIDTKRQIFNAESQLRRETGEGI
jgi:hypothetical protein